MATQDNNAGKRNSVHALEASNFFLADVQTGLGPFLAAYLASAGWAPGRIGFALTLSGIITVVLQTPAGSFVDRVRAKRVVLAVGIAVLACGALLLAYSTATWVVYLSQLLIGAAAPFLAPTLAAITMGLVGTELFDRQFGKNQSFNSAGNVASALVIVAVSHYFGSRGIFLIAAVLTVPTIISIFAIRKDDIDYELARGGKDGRDKEQPRSVFHLLRYPGLGTFLGCAFLFHFANAAMLPQLGEMLSHGSPTSAAPFMSACIIVTQFVIMCSARSIGRFANRHGRKPLLLVGFGVLPFRALLYTMVHGSAGLIGIQMLDGVANAIFGVVAILVVADLTRGTGRFNLVQGALATAIGLGASLSTTFGGRLIQTFSFRVSFLGLGAVAVAAFLLFLFAVPETLHKGESQDQLHLGDLHMEASGEENHRDLQSIVHEINTALSDRIAFTFIPGDIAENGRSSQHEAVRETVDELSSPWCAIVGDHDVHEKSFDNFLHYMAEKTYYDFTVGKVRFFALNAFDEPDPKSFAILPDQLAWLEAGLKGMQPDQIAVLLLHCYPTDLKQGEKELQELIAAYPVRLIDMGHTHYNEIANDGHLLYTATRSTGQREEGPAGFSITNIDGSVISWRFLPLASLPIVMITSPAEERLIPDAQADEQIVSDRLCIRAKVFSAADVQSIEAELLGVKVLLTRIDGSHVYEADIPSATEGVHRLAVRLIDTTGGQAEDEIRIVVGRSAHRSPARKARDQDNAVEAWPERGLLGTQLGPNKTERSGDVSRT